MLDSKKPHPERTEFKRRATARLAQRNRPETEELASLAPGQAAQMLHDLRVQQIDLELQNDELRRTQADLEFAREQYFQLYNFAPTGYCTLDDKGIIRQANLTLANALNVKRSKLVGQPFHHFILRRDQDTFYLHRKDLDGTKEVRSCELRMQRADGSTFWTLLQSSNANDLDGIPVVRILLIDISAVRETEEMARRALQEAQASRAELQESLDTRIRAEKALRDSEVLSQAILDSVSTEIAVIDRNGRILAVNEPWLRFAAPEAREGGLAFPGGEVGSDYLAACRSAAAAGSSEMEDMIHGIRGVLDGEASHFSTEYGCQSKGSERWFSLNATPFGADHRGAVIVHMEVTERRAAEAAKASLEAQLRESQKMEAVGTLAGGIAHDFNNIITVILGNAELLRKFLAGNPHTSSSLEEIWKAAIRARDLVKRILSFSRRQPTERRPVAPGPLVQEAVHFLQATVPARITLAVEIDADTPTVLADPTQIEQVLINLVTNAMQAIPAGAGRICIRLDAVDIDAALLKAAPALHALQARGVKRLLRLAVSDNGIGMDAATLAKVFNPFFTTKASNEGTGLGLSVVHGIVENHEGVITAESTPGVGTTFAVYLPSTAAKAEPLAASAGTPATPAPASATPPHILYIDDEESLVLLVTRLLERGGYRVSGFTDPAKALAALRARPTSFDLVVSDYNMPRLSGLDVARKVRAIRRDLPLAVISGYVDEKLREGARSAGVDHVIFKADAVEELCRTMAGLLKSPATKRPPS